MRRHLASSRSPQSRRLRQVTLVVPESCVEGFRQFANELRARHQAGSTEVTPRWLALSPSAELMVSPERSARCAVRDTRAPGEDRFRWTVAILGQLDPIAQGRTGDRAEARMLAEAAVIAYFGNSEAPPNWWTPLLSSGGSGKGSNGPGTSSFYG